MGRINEQWMAARREAGGSLLFFQSALFGGLDVSQDDMALRRAGGGGVPVSKPIGVMMLLLLAFSALAHLTRQNQVVPAMLVGFIFGAAQLDSAEPYLMSVVTYDFIELGSLLTLFFTGLSVDFDVFSMYLWPQAIKMGFWHTGFLSALLGIIAWSSGLCITLPAICFFGLCGVFASKRNVNLFESTSGTTLVMHVKIARAMHFFGDAVLCLCLVIVKAFERSIIIPHDTSSAATNRTFTNSSDRSLSIHNGHRRASGVSETVSFVTPDSATWSFYLLGDEIFRSCGIWLLASLAFYIIAKAFLGKAFRFFVRDGELLFIGSMSWALGTCAIAHQVGWSMPVAAYLAGFSLSRKNCRVQILAKIGFLRTLALFLFFFMIGVFIKLTPDFFLEVRHGHATNFGWAAVVALVIVGMSRQLSET